MTEKRFTFDYIDGVKVITENGEFVPYSIILKLLNELHEEKH